MRATIAGTALCASVMLSCREAPPPASPEWTVQAAAIADSVRLTVVEYGARFQAADRDSIERFYADDPEWTWAVDGRVGTSSTQMIRARLDELSEFPNWRLRYNKLLVKPVGPGMASTTAEYWMRFGGAEEGPKIYEGAITMFWQHRSSGWKIVGGHTSTLPGLAPVAPRPASASRSPSGI